MVWYQVVDVFSLTRCISIRYY